MSNDLLYQIALTLVPNIGDVHAKLLINIYGDAESVFKAKRKDLEYIEGIGTVRANSIKAFQEFHQCEAELNFIKQYGISPIFISDTAYPQRLLNCYDCPSLLYYRGNANLNTAKIISIVGTRNHSDYGRNSCEKFLDDLKGENILIVSGMAYGIDTIAHKGALKNSLETLGVLAHGLDMMYPSQNKSLAKQMLEQGGLLTEFRSRSKPDKQNFPKRNRIVAGISDAIVVIESGKKGGSLITAELGNGYNKDVFALPGRTIDSKSEGCNYLIRQNKASLITSAQDLLQLMNWSNSKRPAHKKQRELFIELTPAEKLMTDMLQIDERLPIDVLYLKSGLNSSAVAAALLSLEMQGVLTCLPGKIYKLL